MEPYFLLKYKTTEGNSVSFKIPNAATDLNKADILSYLADIKTHNAIVTSKGELAEIIGADLVRITNTTYKVN